LTVKLDRSIIDAVDPTMQWKHAKTLLIYGLVLNSPAILIWLPGFGMLFFLPFLYWINLPGTYLNSWIGKPHYDVQEFGIVPQTPLAWFLIVAAWMLPALAMTALSAWLPELKWRFSVRTLLILTTIVAAILGLLLWASGQ
jgi:hypothetical protein